MDCDRQYVQVTNVKPQITQRPCVVLTRIILRNQKMSAQTNPSRILFVRNCFVWWFWCFKSKWQIEFRKPYCKHLYVCKVFKNESNYNTTCHHSPRFKLAYTTTRQNKSCQYYKPSFYKNFNQWKINRYERIQGLLLCAGNRCVTRFDFDCKNILLS